MIKKSKINAKDALRKHFSFLRILFLYTPLFYLTFAAQAFEIKEPLQTPGLTPQEVQLLAKGEWLVEQSKNSEGPWPILTILGFIAATPLEAVAIYYALDHQKNYIPNMVESTPFKYISATEVYTRHRIKLPWPLDESHYVNGSKLSKIDDKFQVEWYLVENDSAEKVQGKSYFLPYNQGTLLIYHSNIVPKSIFAGILKKIMVNDVKKSLEAIRAEILRAKHSPQKDLLNKYTSYIERSLQGEFVYSMAADKPKNP